MPIASPPTLRRPLDLDPAELRRRVGSWESPALLEGGPGLGDAGRWSFFAARPRRVFESATGAGFRWSGDGLDQESRRDALDGLADLAPRFHLAQPGDYPGDLDAPPFRGGLIGLVGYDLAPRLERLPRRAPPESRIPALRFGLYDTFVSVDHAAGSAEIRAVDLLDEGPASLRDRLDRWAEDLGRTPPPRPPAPRLSGRSSGFTREGYLAAVRRVLEYIAAGDIFQANLSRRLDAIGPVDPLDLHGRLRQASPAPYSAFLAWDDLAVVSASPELFYRTDGDAIVTRPIKGTRPRSADPAEDARLAAELQGSQKDLAELIMIVDLERNDLGRICRFGSVRVHRPAEVESFRDVHHLVATVVGRLRPEVGPVDVLRALFPGGSITGAPKIRAMEIIDELEPGRRSLYTGAIGYLGLDGRSSFNIAIRTMLVEGDRVSYQVGGGIVADSDPEAEYAETLQKGRALRRVLDELGGAG